MSRPMTKRIFPVFLVVIALGSYFAGAGNLTPPVGPVAPTLKTLVEVEPRTVISSLPFSITVGGSYYVTSNLSGVSGQNGININADNVTVDLRGFTLLGVGGSSAGVAVQAGRSNITIEHGAVRSWGGTGVDASNGTRVVIQEVHAGQNGANGIQVGAGSSVNGCYAWQNTAGAGFKVTANGSHLDGNISYDNSRGYQVTGTGSLIVRNVARGNTIADYDIVAGNDYGLILGSPGANFASSAAWANFGGCPVGQSLCGGNCVDTQNDPSNCGVCGNACPSHPNAPGACVMGTCSNICDSGYSDCNMNMGDGCEVNILTDVGNCGSCGHVCSAGANSTPVCTAGICSLVCNSGFQNCNGNLADGCEVNINTNPNNCGACSVQCPVRPNSTPVCSGGNCTIACNSGFRDCNGNLNDGCEVNTNTDVSNCGNCGTTCPNRPNSIPVCNAGACSILCNSGFQNCDGNLVNGCEINLLTDPAHCGNCTNVCPVGHACVNGICQ